MAIDAKAAAKIAKEAGLSLSDARALAALADTEDEATELAQQFSESETDYDAIAERIADKSGGKL